ncbi:hypothetical protein K1T71_006940 [Dendrolimus kikuchii]|uniref:Uncharacterized protein n=1 Tax=Dendrolimus kikuchii TaxID=765133 RepID=A0ACC1CZC4_9NEOP|nr:hypothetical protein K1T71_006940 [Dendrolimus kikuchii]
MVALEAVDAASSFQNFLSIQGAFQILATLNLTSYMYPKSIDVFDGQYFDRIVVGGGTAGCVVATRLAQMDRTKEVLLIEAGGDPPFETTLPPLMLYPLRSRNDWLYSTTKNDFSQLGNEGHISTIFQGKMLGGTNNFPYILYSVGNQHDYDEWALKVKSKSWNWEGVFPYFKRSQRIEDKDIENSEDRYAFGLNGPVVITKDMLPVTREFIPAFAELGIPTPIDSNGNRTIGYCPTLFTIGEGMRQTSAQSYLARFRLDNLKVLKNATVTKVIVNNNKVATGVRVQRRGIKDVTLNARYEIILSAGAINTPKILLHSGIGPKAHLSSKNIPVVVDLPVGRNLLDHVAVLVVYDLVNLRINPIPTNPHIYAQPSFTGYVALDRKAEVPDYETSNFLDFPSNQMVYCVASYDYTFDICNNLFYKENTNQVLWTLVTSLHPESRGYVELRSNNFNDKPIVNPRYLSHPKDLENQAKHVRDFIRVENTTYFRRNGARFVDPRLEECQRFDFKSLDYLKCYIRYMMAPQWQFSGTCAMGPVVDPRMNVRGTRGLRIADASVIPVNISGDIEGPIIMLAEKLADIIKEEYYGSF